MKTAQWGSSQLDFGSGIRIGIFFHRRIPSRIPIRIPFSLLPRLENPLQIPHGSTARQDALEAGDDVNVVVAAAAACHQ